MACSGTQGATRVRESAGTAPRPRSQPAPANATRTQAGTRSSGRAPQLAGHGSHLGLDFAVGAGHPAALGDEHDVVSAGKRVSMSTKGLADEALDPIAGHSVTDFASHGDPQTAWGQVSILSFGARVERRSKHQEVVDLQFAALLLDTQEFPPLSKTKARRKSLGLHVLLTAGGRSEALAATATTRGDDLATTFRSHAGTKAVFTGATKVVGLVGAFHRSKSCGRAGATPKKAIARRHTGSRARTSSSVICGCQRYGRAATGTKHGRVHALLQPAAQSRLPSGFAGSVPRKRP